MPGAVIKLPIKDAVIHQMPRYHDERGFLNEIFNVEKYPEEISKHFPVLQNTVASSVKNVLRGIHISPYAKLMTCVRGSMYDFIVDLRPESPTYMKWCAVVLSEDNCRQLLVPPNCGHGYLAMVDDTMCVYCQGGCFGGNERGISPFDSLVDVYYPLDAGVNPIVSAKDTAAVCLEASSLPMQITPHRERVLIIGASGQVGKALRNVFAQHEGRYSVYGTYNDHGYEGAVMPFDLERAADDIEYTEMILTVCRPHIVIICAAFTWVDGCENQADKGNKLNTLSVRNISKVAESMNARVVEYSTDYVFDGAAQIDVNKPDTWLSEESTTNPLSHYGAQKLQAEAEAMKENKKALIIRTSRVFGPETQGKNIVYQISQRLRKGQAVPCLKEEVSCPTYNKDLALATFLLLEKKCTGVFHVCGPDAWSKFDWGIHTAKYFGLDTSLIQEPTASGLAKRPKDVPMSTTKLRTTLPSFRFHTFTEALADTKAHLDQHLNSQPDEDLNIQW